MQPWSELLSARGHHFVAAVPFHIAVAGRIAGLETGEFALGSDGDPVARVNQFLGLVGADLHDAFLDCDLGLQGFGVDRDRELSALDPDRCSWRHDHEGNLLVFDDFGVIDPAAALVHPEAVAADLDVRVFGQGELGVVAEDYRKSRLGAVLDLVAGGDFQALTGLFPLCLAVEFDRRLTLELVDRRVVADSLGDRGRGVVRGRQL